jgi:hypothetical protein
MNISAEVQKEIQSILVDAYHVTEELDKDIEKSIVVTEQHPLSIEEARKILAAIILKMREGASFRKDETSLKALSGDIESIIERAMSTEKKLNTEPESGQATHLLALKEHNGIRPSPVLPSPVFHQREIPMNSGFVKTMDIRLWEANERLDIHLGQFKAKYGRTPSSQEVLDIMLSKIHLPGITDGDQFDIVELARSIANNGVRKPPVIDLDGTLLDGNRRVAACYFILNSQEFDTEQKKRAEIVFVWQLTDHATDDDRNAVIVSLNYESDCKQEWPEYVKARIISNEWQSMLAREPNPPGLERQRQLKKELSRKFAYGDDPTVVNRYIRMINWANDFEDYHIGIKKTDRFEVKHVADKKFQYFDEISKGTTSGVARALDQDEPFKHLVYDLLLQDKIQNFTWVRNLKFYNDEVKDSLRKAREMPDIDQAAEIVETALNAAKAASSEARVGNPNQRIEIFCKWLEALPIGAFRDEIHPENLTKLHNALVLVEEQIKGRGVIKKSDESPK